MLEDTHVNELKLSRQAWLDWLIDVASWIVVAADIVGPLPRIKAGFAYV